MYTYMSCQHQCLSYINHYDIRGHLCFSAVSIQLSVESYSDNTGLHTKAFILAAKVKILVNNFYFIGIEVIYQNLYFSG